jgi:hypothetical protein
MESSKRSVPHAGVVAGATLDLSRGFYSGIELDAIAYLQLSAQRNLVLITTDSSPTAAEGPVVSVETSRPYAVRLDLVLLGKRW